MQTGSTATPDNYFKDITTPEVKDMELKLDQLVLQGVITPEDAQAALVGESGMNNISLDPKLKSAQMDALSSLQDISSSGGMTNMDKANLSRIATDEAASARGSREAILANAASRGMGGSGLELMSQMQNDQASAGRKSQRDLDVAGMAQQRALDALMKGGQMAGDIQGQDFNRQAQVAGANDAIAKFNAQNQQQVGLTNTGARNAAQAQNVAARQSLADANANLRNQQQQYNKNLTQTNFNNQLARAGGKQEVANQTAQIATANDQARADGFNQTASMVASLGSSALAGGGTAKKKDGGLVMGDPSDQDTMPHMLQPGEMVTRKDDVPDMLKKKHSNDKGEFDVASFLDDITGHKYGYSKGKKNG